MTNVWMLFLPPIRHEIAHSWLFPKKIACEREQLSAGLSTITGHGRIFEYEIVTDSNRVQIHNRSLYPRARGRGNGGPARVYAVQGSPRHPWE